MSDITRKRGDTVILPFTATHGSGVLNLTGAELWFTAKDGIKDNDVDAIIQKTIGNGITVLSAIAGTLEVKIEPADTEEINIAGSEKSFVWDLQVKTADDDVYTLDSGTLTLTPDVTRAS